ncbi:hypothetical protein OJ997_23785 [Solirubrobacter phytolaccae]|uniref:Uncharacterized protein n=1 Tax=Solirubrobacter phytolaccae TaxID=1404360 RepID=A0A9X3NEB3_9ACTN|nr:hypothetical protein [Solirubrobacter phytolaccae]MDA0183352.1 hypothetical protein [Solirubrobacter phytolaccae]
MSFEHALEAELLSAARRRTAARRRRPPALFAVAVATATLALFALVPRGTTIAPSAPASSPPCSAQEALLRAGSCTSNPFSSLSQ